MFEGFRREFITTQTEWGDASIHAMIGGEGPPLLLLHGYPQCHVMWHRIAGTLAQSYTVVATDLRGYGFSSKPETDVEHAPYAKRAMAMDQVQVMAKLGYDRFLAAGHDRGGRVLHRMALDHPDAVSGAALLDIIPTRTLCAPSNQSGANNYFHWFFLSQPAPFPETLIENARDFWLRSILGAWGANENAFTEDSLAVYDQCFDRAAIHASCEDYRAGATLDLVHDREDAEETVSCPLLVLWGTAGRVAKNWDVMAEWRPKADRVEGFGLECGHFLPEERPEETARALMDFFGRR